MKNFIFLFITVFIIELFPKTVYATMELSIDFGGTFKQSLKYEGDEDDEDDNDRTFKTSLQVLATLPSFFYKLPIDMGIGSTSIGLRQSAYATNIKGDSGGSLGVVTSMLSFLLKQRFKTITEDYRGFYPELIVGIALFQLQQWRLTDNTSLNIDRWLGGFLAGAGVGYKLMDHFFIRGEVGWIHSTFTSKSGLALSAPYVTLGIGWFFSMPSPSSSVEESPSNSVEGSPL